MSKTITFTVTDQIASELAMLTYEVFSSRAGSSGAVCCMCMAYGVRLLRDGLLTKLITENSFKLIEDLITDEKLESVERRHKK